MGWGLVQTQGDLGLGGVGYFPVRTQYGLGADFVARPNGVGGWVHIRTQEGLNVGHSESEPKGVWVKVCVRAQNGFGSFPVQT